MLDPTLERLLYLFLGWLLGVLSPLVVDAIRLRRTRREVRGGIKAEVLALRYRLAHVAFGLVRMTGEWNRQFFEWLLPAVEEADVALETRMAEAVRGMLGYSEEQLTAAAAASRNIPGVSLSFKRYELPYLEAQFHQIIHLKPATHRALLEIRAQLSIFNEVVEEIRGFNAMTFQDLSAENRKAVESNLQAAYKNATDRCKIIIDLAGKLEL